MNLEELYQTVSNYTLLDLERIRSLWNLVKDVRSRKIEGDVVEIVDFGSFIRIGPLDGLVHVSQICDDYISYEQVGNRFIGKETGKILEVNDVVKARIIAVSLGTGRSGNRIRRRRRRTRRRPHRCPARP